MVPQTQPGVIPEHRIGSKPSVPPGVAPKQKEKVETMARRGVESFNGAYCSYEVESSLN